MEFGLLQILNLLGSLGFFIYGMKIMSEGIQKVAGSKMRQILSAMTSNRVKGVFTGFTITGLVQSSSATTVLVVSFVNAGLLSLTESIGVIMGANIGTTITAWLISIVGFKVKIATYALPIIAFGFPLLFTSKDKLKSWGEVAIGFALLFMGLAYLKSSVPDLKSNPEALEFLANYTDLGFLSILLFVAIGTLLTVIVQSSSAAMALTLVMANNGWIPFELAAAMVLGENIGTTITANLAAIVGNVHAKRAAFSHFIFNMFGVTWILILFYPMLSLVDGYMMSSGMISPNQSAESVPIALSIFHTTFNIINTLLLIWFTNFIANVATRTIKAKGDEDFSLKYISTNLLNTSELGVEEARKETAHFAEIMTKMSKNFLELVEGVKPKKEGKLIKKMKKHEEIADRMEEEISTYLVKISSDGTLSKSASERVTSMLSITNDLERIADLFYQMTKDLERKRKKELTFTPKQIENLKHIATEVDDAILIMHENLNQSYSNVTIDKAAAQENKINETRNKLRKENAKRMDKDTYEVKAGSMYKDIFHSCEKVGDHAINVSEAITGELHKEVLKYGS